MSVWKTIPRVVEAFVWTGGHDQVEDPEWFIKVLEEGHVKIETRASGPILVIGKAGDHLRRAPVWVVKDGVDLKFLTPTQFSSCYTQVQPYKPLQRACDGCGGERWWRDTCYLEGYDPKTSKVGDVNALKYTYICANCGLRKTVDADEVRELSWFPRTPLTVQPDWNGGDPVSDRLAFVAACVAEAAEEKPE